MDLPFDEAAQAFYFYGLQQKHYYVAVSRHDCFPSKKTIFLSGAPQFSETLELVSCIQTSLVFKTVNLIEGHVPIPDVLLEINQVDNGHHQQQQGTTNSKGLFSCSGLMFKTLQVKATAKGFLTIPLEFDVKAQSTGAILNIPMIPDYYVALNQYHVLVYVPNKNDFMLRFKLQCPDGTVISTK